MLAGRRGPRCRQWGLSDLDFADDVALIDEPEGRLQAATSQEEENAVKVGLSVNSKKTRVMSISRDQRDITIFFTNRGTLDNVERFVCLSSAVTYDGDLPPEIDSQIEKAADAFNKLAPFIKHRAIRLGAGMQVCRSVVVSTLLYSAEAWNSQGCH